MASISLKLIDKYRESFDTRFERRTSFIRVGNSQLFYSEGSKGARPKIAGKLTLIEFNLLYKKSTAWMLNLPIGRKKFIKKNSFMIAMF